MIKTTNFEEAKKLIKKESKPIIVEAQNSEFNRKMLEYGHFDVLLSIEKEKSSRSLRSIDSGLNEVLARIAAKNKVAIGIDLEEIRSLDKKNKSLRLLKIIQNIKLCRKSHTKMKILNFKDKNTAFSLLLSLGASSKEANEAIAF